MVRPLRLLLVGFLILGILLATPSVGNASVSTALVAMVGGAAAYAAIVGILSAAGVRSITDSLIIDVYHRMTDATVPSGVTAIDAAKLLMLQAKALGQNFIPVNYDVIKPLAVSVVTTYNPPGGIEGLALLTPGYIVDIRDRSSSYGNAPWPAWAEALMGFKAYTRSIGHNSTIASVWGSYGDTTYNSTIIQVLNNGARANVYFGMGRTFILDTYAVIEINLAEVLKSGSDILGRRYGGTDVTVARVHPSLFAYPDYVHNYSNVVRMGLIYVCDYNVAPYQVSKVVAPLIEADYNPATAYLPDPIPIPATLDDVDLVEWADAIRAGGQALDDFLAAIDQLERITQNMRTIAEGGWAGDWDIAQALGRIVYEGGVPVKWMVGGTELGTIDSNGVISVGGQRIGYTTRGAIIFDPWPVDPDFYYKIGETVILTQKGSTLYMGNAPVGSVVGSEAIINGVSYPITSKGIEIGGTTALVNATPGVVGINVMDLQTLVQTQAAITSAISGLESALTGASGVLHDTHGRVIGLEYDVNQLIGVSSNVYNIAGDTYTEVLSVSEALTNIYEMLEEGVGGGTIDIEALLAAVAAFELAMVEQFGLSIAEAQALGLTAGDILSEAIDVGIIGADMLEELEAVGVVINDIMDLQEEWRDASLDWQEILASSPEVGLIPEALKALESIDVWAGILPEIRDALQGVPEAIEAIPGAIAEGLEGLVEIADSATTLDDIEGQPSRLKKILWLDGEAIAAAMENLKLVASDRFPFGMFNILSEGMFNLYGEGGTPVVSIPLGGQTLSFDMFGSPVTAQFRDAVRTFTTWIFWICCIGFIIKTFLPKLVVS